MSMSTFGKYSLLSYLLLLAVCFFCNIDQVEGKGCAMIIDPDDPNFSYNKREYRKVVTKTLKSSGK